MKERERDIVAEGWGLSLKVKANGGDARLHTRSADGCLSLLGELLFTAGGTVRSTRVLELAKAGEEARAVGFELAALSAHTKLHRVPVARSKLLHLIIAARRRMQEEAADRAGGKTAGGDEGRWLGWVHLPRGDRRREAPGHGCCGAFSEIDRRLRPPVHASRSIRSDPHCQATAPNLNHAHHS